MNQKTAKRLRKVNLARSQGTTPELRRSSLRALKTVWNRTPRNERRQFLMNITKNAGVELRNSREIAAAKNTVNTPIGA